MYRQQKIGFRSDCACVVQSHSDNGIVGMRSYAGRLALNRVVQFQRPSRRSLREPQTVRFMLSTLIPTVS